MSSSTSTRAWAAISLRGPTTPTSTFSISSVRPPLDPDPHWAALRLRLSCADNEWRDRVRVSYRHNFVYNGLSNTLQPEHELLIIGGDLGAQGSHSQSYFLDLSSSSRIPSAVLPRVA